VAVLVHGMLMANIILIVPSTQGGDREQNAVG
jgi:hypothetical protein